MATHMHRKYEINALESVRMKVLNHLILSLGMLLKSMYIYHCSYMHIYVDIDGGF